MEKEIIILSDDQAAYLTAYLFPNTPDEGMPWRPEERPAVLITPGGGYNYCSEREADPVALAFLRAGYQAFVLTYHTGNASAYPTPLLEMAKSMAHIRAHSQEYGIHPDHVAVTGFSAGGHLAAVYGSSWHQPILSELVGLDCSTMSPNALVLGYPIVNLRPFMDRSKDPELNVWPMGAMLRQYAPEIDPLALINKRTPPTFIFTTREDDLILPLETHEYAAALLRHNIPCEYHLFSAGQHGLSTADSLSNYGRAYPARVQQWVPMALDWLGELFGYVF